MWQKVANIILKNRFFILGIIALMTIFLTYYAATALRIENRYGILLPQDTQVAKEYKKFKSLFGEDGGTLAISIKTDSLYTEKNFKYWKELGDSILQIRGVESVVSEATLFTIHNNIESSRFEIKRIFSDISFREKSIDSIKKEIKRNPVYNGVLYNDETNVSLMLIRVDERFLADQKKSKFILEIEALANSYESHFGQLHFTGLPHMRVIIAKRIQQDMFVFITASLLITALVLYLFFRSFRAMFICLIVVGISVAWALGTISLLGYKLSVLMALIPPLMIVIAVPNCVYLITKYHQEVKECGNKYKALSMVVQKMGMAIFMTNVMNAIGFFTAVLNSEKLLEFGVVSSLNVMLIFLLSITLMPIFLSFSKVPKPRHLKHLDRKSSSGMISGIENWILNKRSWVYIITIAVLVISVLGMFQIKATGNITSDIPKSDQIYKDLKVIENNFGGSIPFEILVDYKEPGRLFKNTTLSRVEEVQNLINEDALFSKSLSLVDFIKVINMAYYSNDVDKYKIISSKDKLRLKKYLDNLDMTGINGGGLSIKEMVDTSSTTIRIRCQMKDLATYEVGSKVEELKVKVDSLLNPDRKAIERLYDKVAKGKMVYMDSLIENYPSIYNSLTAEISKGNEDLQYQFDSDPELIKKYYHKKDFKKQLKSAIANDYYDITFTGTSIVASESTRYLIRDFIFGIMFAILSISILMAFLFRSWRMVVIAMIPNIIPLVVTAGVMGWVGIPLKPSTLLVFNIALSISVDDAIHFLEKYRQSVRSGQFTMLESVFIAVRDTGLGRYYTSIVLFCGFSVFLFSQFGGTQALGALVSLTLFVAMVTNFIILPSLLLSLNKFLQSKTFEYPYFEAHSEESEVDWTNLQVDEAGEEEVKK